MYLLGAIAHVALGIAAPSIYAEFADQALVAAYTTAWNAWVVPNLWLLQPLVIVFEAGVAIALLARGSVVRVGHVAGATFQAGLILSGPWGPVNAGLVALHLAALRFEYPTPVSSRRIDPPA